MSGRDGENTPNPGSGPDADTPAGESEIHPTWFLYKLLIGPLIAWTLISCFVGVLDYRESCPDYSTYDGAVTGSVLQYFRTVSYLNPAYHATYFMLTGHFHLGTPWHHMCSSAE